MGKTRYNRLRVMLDKLKSEYGDDIDLELLQKRFLIEIGADIRTKRDGIKQMLELNMIKEENGRIKIA